MTVCSPETVTAEAPDSEGAPAAEVITEEVLAAEAASVPVQPVTVTVAVVESDTGVPPSTGVTVTVLTACRHIERAKHSGSSSKQGPAS